MSSYQIVLTSSGGSTVEVDLTKAGKVYGKLDACRSESGECDIKTVELANEGFEGVYGVPRTIEKSLKQLRRLGHELDDELLEHLEHRRLQNENSK